MSRRSWYTLSARLSTRTTNATSSTSAARLSASSICCVDSTHTHTHNGLLYFHTQVKNTSNVPYEVDFVTFKIVDKQVMKRTAIQEQVIFPLRAYDYATTVAGNKDERTVFVFDKFTIPADKVLVVEMHEKSGGRHKTFTVESEDIVRAKVINELKVK